MSARATEGDGRWVLLRRVQVFTFDSLFLDESTFSSRPAMQTAQDSLGKYLLSRLSMRSERRVCVCGCRGEQTKIVAIIIIVVGRAGQRRKDTKCSIKKKMIYTHQNKLSASRLAQ